jgi:hypothetical protein
MLRPGSTSQSHSGDCSDEFTLENNSLPSNQSQPCKRSWLDSVKEEISQTGLNIGLIDDSHIPYQSGIATFLQEVREKDRRGLLAGHRVNTDTAKEDSSETSQCQIQSVRGKYKRKTKYLSHNYDWPVSRNCKKSAYHTPNYMEFFTVRLNEPHILRSSIYEKLAASLQHFYNEQDAMSIETYILTQLCVPDVTKTFLFWNTPTTASTSTSSTTKLVNLSNSSERKRLTYSKAFTLIGAKDIANSCSMIFQTVPDSVIQFHPITVETIEENEATLDTLSMISGGSSPDIGDGIVVKAPYSYFFKLPIISAGDVYTTTSNPMGMQAEHTTVNNSRIITMIDVELMGCVELTFSRNNHQIAHIFDHVAIAAATRPSWSPSNGIPNSNSLPSVTSTFSLSMSDMVKYMGYTS